MANKLRLPPLTLYVHLPWCVRKCPYCDFNSHALRGAIPENAYIDALLADLDQDIARTGARPPRTVFLGGGTPSLFSPRAIARLLEGIDRACPLAENAEITLEANPGTVETRRFRGYRAAGVNRLSLGVQSFNEASLKSLGRIHGRAESLAAVDSARAAGFDNLNLDLMYALPRQTPATAEADVSTALSLAPAHISYYQLTLEPGTAFHHRPPALPDDETAWTIQRTGQALLRAHGYRQYEVSAYARPGRRCRHNLNYWRFGDYLGIGAGAHGKLSMADGRILRTRKPPMPRAYMAAAPAPETLVETHNVGERDLPLEFTLNALRLREGFPLSVFEARTGLGTDRLRPPLDKLARRGLIRERAGRVRPSRLGWRHLNELMLAFLPEELAP
jgi:oxygen-independent coproporphyrinogen-3 oxidase